MPSAPSSASKTAPVTPRPAAALIVLSGPRVLMIKRPNHHSYPGAYVFPGGTVSSRGSSSSSSSPSSGDSFLRFTALRELFEETGLLLSTAPIPASKRALLPTLQRAVHDNTLPFSQAVRDLGVDLVSDDHLLPFSTWTTPVGPKKRYETHFFVTRLPAHLSEAAVVGDGGIEVVGAHWMDARSLPQWVREGRTPMHSAQIYLTARLAHAIAGGGEGVSWGEGERWEAVRRVSEEIGGAQVHMRRSDENGRRVETLHNGDRVVYDVGEGSAGRAWVERRDKARL